MNHLVVVLLTWINILIGQSLPPIERGCSATFNDQSLIPSPEVFRPGAHCENTTMLIRRGFGDCSQTVRFTACLRYRQDPCTKVNHWDNHGLPNLPLCEPWRYAERPR